MNSYSYRCNNCDSVFTLMDIEDVNAKQKCPKCKSDFTVLKRMVYGCEGMKNTHTGDYEHVSASLAIAPSQIAEHRAAFPNIDILPDGRPKFTSVKQQSDYLEKTGFVKVPQKVRHRL